MRESVLPSSGAEPRRSQRRPCSTLRAWGCRFTHLVFQCRGMAVLPILEQDWGVTNGGRDPTG